MAGLHTTYAPGAHAGGGGVTGAQGGGTAGDAGAHGGGVGGGGKSAVDTPAPSPRRRRALAQVLPSQAANVI